ncbi:MAG: YitT family protein [Clostridia bacterium]|nr:YitT family protein [Clostridia bacterium]
MLEKLKRLRRIRWQNMIMLTVAGIINAIGVTIFLYPVNLYDSGISGTSMLLSQVTPEYLTLSLFLAALNIPLFLFGLKKQGKLFTFYAVYTVGIYSLFAWLITDIFPVDVSVASPLAGTDLLLCALFGGVISGIGSGLAIRFGGAMDGIEVMAVIFAKKLGITVGTFVMIYNVILYIICGIVIKSWILPLYSIVTYAAALKTVDFMVEGFDRAKGAMIITKMPDEICEALADEFESGMTKISAKGGYSGSDLTVVYFVVNRFQVSKMQEIVHAIDRDAYITISEVADVFASNQDKS